MTYQKDNKKPTTSWDPVSQWYKKIVGDEGHYYHRQVILPKILEILKDKTSSSTPNSLLDVGCGPGVLGKHWPKNLTYTGIDLSPALIQTAQQNDPSPAHRYLQWNAENPYAFAEKKFTHAAIILALQNMKHPAAVFANIRTVLADDGKLVIVLNHPCFRIPRQSGWGTDEAKKLQYRRIDRYSTTMEIPIAAQPSKGEKSVTTLSYHWSLATLSGYLHESGFAILRIDEWHSDKNSSGKNAKMEDRARSEIPLFMTLVCQMR